MEETMRYPYPYPDGFTFEPTDEEIIISYLIPKLEDRIMSYFGFQIVELQIYDTLPWDLNWATVHNLCKHERYFFVKRTPATANSKKRARRTLDKRHSTVGHWKMSGTTPIQDSLRGLTIGYRRALNFLKYQVAPDGKQTEVKTECLMHEYTLSEDNQQFQEWVVCKIKRSERKQQQQANNWNINVHGNQPQVPPPVEDHSVEVAVAVEQQAVNVSVEDHTQVQQQQHDDIYYDDFVSELNNDPVLLAGDDDEDDRPCKRLHAAEDQQVSHDQYDYNSIVPILDQQQYSQQGETVIMLEQQQSQGDETVIMAEDQQQQKQQQLVECQSDLSDMCDFLEESGSFLDLLLDEEQQVSHQYDYNTVVQDQQQPQQSQHGETLIMPQQQEQIQFHISDWMDNFQQRSRPYSV